MENVAIPAWCKPNAWVFNPPTRTVFQASRLQRDRTNGTLYLQDTHGHDYPLAECQELNPRNLTATATLAGTSIQIHPHPQGFLVAHGPTRKLVRIPDEGYQAAQSLAKFFQGTITCTEPT